MMNRLGNCVVYHDMESIIYIYKSQEWNRPTREYFSDLTDELSWSKQGAKDVNEVTGLQILSNAELKCMLTN